MARPLRIEFPGAVYHLINKGEKSHKVFEDDIDKKIFFSLIASAAQMYSIRLFCFSLMDTHYHLLMETAKANLSKVMHYIGGVYTQRYNHRHKCDGHVFRGRYKSILVEKESYLCEVARYIHLNPVRAGIVRNAEDHLWTSHRLYINDVKCPSWIHTGEILSLFGKDIKSARKAFDDFLREGVPEHIEKIYKKKRLPAVIGSEKFIKAIKKRFIISQMRDYELPEAKRIGRVTLETISVIVSKGFGVIPDSLRQGRRGSKNQARRCAIYIARNYAGYSLKEIGAYFGIKSYTGVSTIISEMGSEIIRDKLCEEKLHALVKEIGHKQKYKKNSKP